MSKKNKPPFSQRSFATTLYVSLCIDAMLQLQTGVSDDDSEITEILLPLLEELFEGVEILS